MVVVRTLAQTDEKIVFVHFCVENFQVSARSIHHAASLVLFLVVQQILLL